MTVVSVALATRDGEAHLPVQLASLADQDRPPDELVVVDDASTDATVEVLERFAGSAPFPVRIERRSVAGGVHSAFAAALGSTRGDVVALCDQDDWWAPAHLGTLVRALPDTAAVAVALGDARLVDGRGAPLGGTAWDLLAFDRAERRRFRRDPMPRLLSSGASPGCTMAATRAALDAALPLPDELRAEAAPVLHDRWLCLVAAALGRVVVVEEVLGDYRRHEGQASGARTVAGARRAGVRRAALQMAGPGAAAERLGVRATQVEVLAARADERGAASEVTARLAAAAAHLRARAALPRSRPARLGPVLRAAAGGRYRWAGGLRGALADVVRPLGPARPAR